MSTYAEITEHDRIIYSTKFIPIGARPSTDPNLTNPEKTVASAPTVPTETPDTGWDLTNVSKLASNAELAVNLTDPTAFTFMDSGNKLLVYDSADSTVNCWTLSSAYSLSGASYDGACAVVGNVVEMWVDDTGTTAFFLRNISEVGGVNKYTMSTPFDISTLSYDSRISVGEGYWKGMNVSTNGYHLYVGSSKGYVKHIYMYFPLQFGWTEVLETVDISGSSSIDGIVVNPAGTRMYVADASLQSLRQYTLNTAYYITDHDYDDLSFDLTGTGVVSLFIEDEEYADIFGITDDKVYKYKVSLTFISSDITTWTYTGLNDSKLVSGNTTGIYAMLCHDEIGKFFVGTRSTYVKEYSITGQDISTIADTGKSYLVTTDYAGSSGVYQMLWANNGTKFYVCVYRYQSEGFLEYDALTPYDINTLTFTGNNLIFNGNRGGWFSADGTKLCMLRKYFNTDECNIRYYTLSTPWDLSTASFDLMVKFYSDDVLENPIPNPDGSQVYMIWSYSGTGMRRIDFDDPFNSAGNISYTPEILRPGYQTWAHALSSDGKYYYSFSVTNRDIRQWATDIVSA